MKCTICERNMDKGEVFIQTSMLKVLAIGLSGNSLQFRSAVSGDRIEILASKPLIPLCGHYHHEAYRCDGCGCVTILPAVAK